MLLTRPVNLSAGAPADVDFLSKGDQVKLTIRGLTVAVALVAVPIMQRDARAVSGATYCSDVACEWWEDTSAGGSAIRGTATGGPAIIGESSASGTLGIGVSGSSTKFVGVYGITQASSGGAGVVGNATTGANHGVEGLTTASAPYAGLMGSSSASSSAIGVYGTVSGTGSNGVQGDSPDWNGVLGQITGTDSSNRGAGVAGAVPASTSGAAIFGDAGWSSTAWAGIFNGDIEARSLYNTSDSRLKTDVVDIKAGLAEVLKLRPVTYKWKADNGTGPEQHGLIAQEVQAVIPNLTRTDPRSGMLSLSYTELIPVLIKAVQQQQAVIQAQNDRLAKLEGHSSAGLEGPSGVKMGLLMGILPIGLIVGLRRRKSGDS